MSQYHLPPVRWHKTFSEAQQKASFLNHNKKASSKFQKNYKNISNNTFKIIILLCSTILLPLLLDFSNHSVNAQNPHSSPSHSDSEYSEPVTFYGDESHCRGEWRHPANCDSVSCDYKATWEYHDEGDEIVFTISTKNRNKWTGIGFSENQAMPETDTILGLVEESGRFFLMDSWLQAYEAPPLDPIQNLYNQTAWREAGVTTLRFSRPRLTGDSRDYQFSDTNCPYFIFPVMGGVFNAVNKRIRKHEATPIISDRRICVRSCRAPSTVAPTLPPTVSSPSSASSPAVSSEEDNNSNPQINNKDHSQPESPSGDNPTSGNDQITKIYRVELKMYNFITGKARRMNSEAYQELITSFEEALYSEVKQHYPRVRRIEVAEVALRDGSADSASNTVITNGNAIVIADFLVSQPKNVDANTQGQSPSSESSSEEKDETQALTVAITSSIRDGQIGDYAVDQNYLVVGPKASGSIAAWINKVFGINYLSRFSEEEQRWILAGIGVSALILLALLQACCMFCGCCRRKSKSTRSMSDDFMDEKEQQWKDYHDQYGGYPSTTGYDDYTGYGSRASSLHKQRHHERHHPASNYQYDEYAHRYATNGLNGHTLERRNYEQQQQQQQQQQQYHTRGREERHRNFGPAPYSVQPDFYFMPHQRKYSSEQQRSMYVDYEGH